MWLVFTVDNFLAFDLKVFGILPRTLHGTIGIITAPLIHGDSTHIISNTIPILFLGWALFFFYENIAPRVFYLCYFLTNILVWLVARPNLHIGASGLLYGLASFLVFYGIFKKDFKSILISVVVVFFYGGMVYGILPTQPGISWESHLMGGIVGAFVAMNEAKRSAKYQ